MNMAIHAEEPSLTKSVCIHESIELLVFAAIWYVCLIFANKIFRIDILCTYKKLF